ncbi:MAG: hypothetical protein M1834_002385 [Cirrosporium novae-zelandiae]|nr:MAG: hypothetical protein M1834_002385 [Cirrosporium novae-zelandiae]
MGLAENGHAFQSPPNKQNGHLVPTPRPRTKTRKQQRGYVAGTVSIAARLLLWYTVFTALLRCPSSLDDFSGESPQVCRPYLIARGHAAPYVQPYYDTYAAPYVDQARPYIKQLDEQVYTPALKYGKKSYQAYGAPKVDQAMTYGYDQWEKVLQPQFKELQRQTVSVYDAKVAPHVQKVSTSILPYMSTARDTAQQNYEAYMLPAYIYTKPHAQHAYLITRNFTLDIIVPYSQTVWKSTLTFIDRKILPKVRILYGENVEPQLVRIGERLGRYRDGKSLKAAIEDIDNESSSSSVASSLTSVSSSIASVHSVSLSAVSAVSETEVPQASPSITPEEEAEKVHEKTTLDLRNWQEKFAKAADKGSDDLKERISEITERQIENQAQSVGKSLIIELEETVRSQITSLKDKINSIVESLPEDWEQNDVDVADSELSSAVRTAGLAIKNKAQEIRSWKDSYIKETYSLVKAAVDSTVEVLDEIRDLGLQEIGMRWAWMEGVTYKDWANYHELKKTFDEWRGEVKATAHHHDGLGKSKAAGDEIESMAMSLAEDSAKELTIIKQVGLWKIRARDVTDDFSTRTVPAPVLEFGKKMKDQLDEASKAIIGEDSSSEETFSDATRGVKDTISSVSASLIGQEPGLGEKATSAIASHVSEASDHIEAATSSISEKASKIADAASSGHSSGEEAAISKVWGGAMAQDVKGGGPILDDFDEDDEESVLKEAQGLYADASKAVSEALLGPSPTQGTVESITALANDKYSSALDAASRVLYGTPQASGESFASLASEKYADAVSAASLVIYGTPTPLTESWALAASSAYDSAIKTANKHYSHAMSIASERISGTPKPIHEQMLSSIESAYSGSMSSARARLESAMSAGRSSFTRASDVAQQYVAPTQGVLESISSIASIRLSDGLSMASVQFESAKTAAGATPTPMYKQYLMDSQRRYYEAVGLAHDRYSVFMSSASNAVYGSPTPIPESLYRQASQALYGAPKPQYQSVIDAARSQYGNAVSVASENLKNILVSATSAVSATSKSPAQSLIDSASSQYSAALSQASAKLEAVSASASSLAFGTPTGSVESLSSVASENWEALVSKVSEQIYGSPTPFTAQATQAVAAQYGALQALISELVNGKEPDFTESVMNRLSYAYYTGYSEMGSSASSYASDAYASATSAMGSIFTPPPTLEAILESANSRLNDAIDAASIQVYGTPQGAYESVTSVVADSYNSIQSQVASAFKGNSYVDAAQNQIQEAAASAQNAISVAIYGTPTGTAESIASAASEAFASLSTTMTENVLAASSVVDEAYSKLSAKASSAVYGPEQGAMESAQSRLNAAVESARAKLSNLVASAGENAGEALEQAKSSVKDFANSIGSAASSATNRVKDEL